MPSVVTLLPVSGELINFSRAPVPEARSCVPSGESDAPPVNASPLAKMVALPDQSIRPTVRFAVAQASPAVLGSEDIGLHSPLLRVANVLPVEGSSSCKLLIRYGSGP